MSATEALGMARELAFHMLNGAWAADDPELLALVEAEAPEMDARQWSQVKTPSQKNLVDGLLLKAADSDWSWEVSALTGREPSEFQAAFERYRMNETDA